MNDKKKCCICKKEYSGYGNNPAPVKDRGLCCDACNYGVVIPIRAAALDKRLSTITAKEKAADAGTSDGKAD